MHFKVAEARRYLASFDLQRLFLEGLGWDRANQSLEISADGERFTLSAVAHKRGLAVYLCSPMPDGSIPPYALRAKIEARARANSHEHLIIFADRDRTIQKWQWVRREPGKPIARREYEKTEVVLQRLQNMAFDLSEEEDLTIVEVGRRVRGALDVEKVTKKFYDRFKKEHDDFSKFIKGIPDKDMQSHYVSVTLNRLMFVYFIQAKGFLDNNPKYLRGHLEESKKRGKDLFYSDFLCPLFFDGFAKKKHSAETKKLLGNIPYLNGGIFERHQIEELHGEKIQIPDRAFEQLFDFFNEYRWHLDERPNKDDKEINPDVLGYIFEKYINQKQMGAYYTKEDITEYIAKNTIIPHLFDAAQKEYPSPLAPLPRGEGDKSAWKLLQADPDRYIYSAVRYEVEELLPTEIAVGLDDPKRREAWNKPAPAKFALPTEIWREVVARRRRYQEVKGKLTRGEVTSINDLITLNLDIRQFAQDVIEDSDADLLAAFWKALTQVKILDPTVGSGAFLFAALNILEPLYEACLMRMSILVEELDQSGEKHSPKKYEPFRKALEQVRQRPDEDYFIFKSIIINNLYGVDIMEEAVEICKLRLFLKLASQVEPDAAKENLGIEPLPDIDFNIRAGNTLVGFATREDVKRSVQFGTVDGVASARLFAMPEEDAQLRRIEEKAADVDRLYKLFRQQQTELGGEVNADDKKQLEKKLKALEDELNILLSKQYGIQLPFPGRRGDGGEVAYKKWLASHTPFHWFVEFYGIMNEGGFDVILGNPPYVEYSKVKKEYEVLNYATLECDDLYGFVMERSEGLLSKTGRFGMIVPVSSTSTDGFDVLRKYYAEKSAMSWISNYAERPSKLFVGVEKRLTIWLAQKNPKLPKENYLSKYHRWLGEERPNLFSLLQYVGEAGQIRLIANTIPKINDDLEPSILGKLQSQKALKNYFPGKSSHIIYYTRKLRYFVQFFDFIPSITNERNEKLPPSELKDLHLATNELRDAALAILNSSTYFWFMSVYSDVRNVNKREILAFRCSLNRLEPSILEELSKLARSLMKDFKKNSRVITNDYGKHGVLSIQSFQPRLSKPLIDEIDRALARHYGLNDEELDFIINYDVKYRMGRSDDE